MPFRDGTGPMGTGPVGWHGRFWGCPYRTRTTRKEYLKELKKEKQALDEEIKDLENAKTS